MARSYDADYIVIPTLQLTASRPIREGGDGGTHYGELDLAKNVNWLHAHHWGPVATWAPVQTYPFTTTSTTPVLYALWRRETPTDCGDYEVKIRANMTGATDTGHIRLEMATGGAGGAGGSSDSAEGATVNVTGTGTATYTTNWTPDVSETVDTIELHAWMTGTTDTLRIYSVEIYPQELASPLSSGVTGGGFVPFDTTEIAADEPLSTLWRKIARDDLEVVRKNRMPTLVSYSDETTRGGTSQYSSTSATYERVIRVPFVPPFGATSVKWGFHAYCSGGTCKVKIETVTGGSSVEVTVGTTWTSPYSAAEKDWDGDGGALTVNSNVPDELRVSLNASGGNTVRLMSFTAWIDDVA